MLDPFPLRSPPFVTEAAKIIAEYTGLMTLPDHLHEILIAATIYQLTLSFVAPAVSNLLVPKQYAKLSPRTRFNWNIHFVALVQAVIVCVMAGYLKYQDKEHQQMGWRERVYGYTGAQGLVQAFTAGYFIWDLYICARFYSMFGFGMLAHAICGLTVYGLGFKPFVNYHGMTFVFYELSSPFLNIHWFCDKLEWTGGYIQLINGIILLITFAGCRLIYGTYASYNLWSDILKMVKLSREAPYTPPLGLSTFAINATQSFNNPIEALQVVKFAPLTPHIDTWLWVANLAANVTLMILNWYWYAQMISAIRKRFAPPFGTKRKEKVESDVQVLRSTDGNGRKKVEVDSVEVKRRQPQRHESLHAA